VGAVRKDFLFYEKTVERKKRGINWRGKSNSPRYR
jgi:hypothetical protein